MIRSYGAKFAREWSPHALVDTARAAEGAGLDELWLLEDLGFHGGFGPCGVALAVTERVRVGLAISPAVVRNAAFLAMEIASLAAMFPGRFHMGLGHGVAAWIDQVGETPGSWLGSLRETTEAVRRIISGETVTVSGDHVRLTDVALRFPARAPISLGVRGPRGMSLAGDVADGVIFAELSGPRYVERVRRDLGPDARLTVLVHASTDVARLRTMIGQRLAQPRFHGQLVDYEPGLVQTWVEQAGGGSLPSGDDPTFEFGIGGPTETWAEQAEKWFAAGADSVVFSPTSDDEPGEIAAWRITR